MVPLPVDLAGPLDFESCSKDWERWLETTNGRALFVWGTVRGMEGEAEGELGAAPVIARAELDPVLRRGLLDPGCELAESPAEAVCSAERVMPVAPAGVEVSAVRDESASMWCPPGSRWG